MAKNVVLKDIDGNELNVSKQVVELEINQTTLSFNADEESAVFNLENLSENKYYVCELNQNLHDLMTTLQPFDTSVLEIKLGNRKNTTIVFKIDPVFKTNKYFIFDLYKPFINIIDPNSDDPNIICVEESCVFSRDEYKNRIDIATLQAEECHHMVRIVFDEWGFATFYIIREAEF